MFDSFSARLQKKSGKQGLFSQERIAQAFPDFDGNTRQRVDDHARRFRESGNDLNAYLTRRRKGDDTVVEAVRAEVLECPLRRTTDVVKSVNQRLNRHDVNTANITAALESISLAEARPVLRGQLAEGNVHSRESSLLETMMERMSEVGG